MTAIAVAEKRMTIPEFLELDIEEGYIYELINGIVMRRTSPDLIHQEASANLHFALMAFIKPKNLGKIFAAPTDVYLNQFDLVVPDLTFVAMGNPATLHGSRYVHGVPDLIIEILSKGTQNVDRGRKMKQYQANKVAEYWIVDPRLQSIEVYELRDNVYEMVSYAEEEGEIVSSVLVDFRLEVKDVFVWESKGDSPPAIRMYEEAFYLEKEAALALLNEEDKEPTRSVLFRSAAALALNCKLWREAEKMIAYGLSGNPTNDLAQELRDLYSRIPSIKNVF